MWKRITYLALLISLVGQFLLTPAMAMPKYLHASSHTSQHVQQVELTSLPINPALVSEISIHQDAGNCGSAMLSANSSPLDCDALCQILGAGDCLSHCISSPAIMEQDLLSLFPQQAGQSLQTLFWSPQTAEKSSVNPPPILFQA